jgi:hypothetical protein
MESKIPHSAAVSAKAGQPKASRVKTRKTAVNRFIFHPSFFDIITALKAEQPFYGHHFPSHDCGCIVSWKKKESKHMGGLRIQPVFSAV